MPTSTGSPLAPLPPPRRASTVLNYDEILLLIRDCDALLQRDARCLDTRAVRGHACMKAKLWDRAVIDFTAILGIRPDDVHVRFSRGMALFKRARVDAAHADFSRVLELNPHHVMARYARAGCFNTEGKFYHAIEEYTLALQHDELENDKMIMCGARHGKLSHRSFYGDEIQKSEEDEPVAEQQRVSERRATLDAVAAWSPPKRTAQFDPRNKSALPHDLSLATESRLRPHPATDTSINIAAATVTAKKKPGKVVQVSLNLSDCVPVPPPPDPVPSADPMSRHVADVTIVDRTPPPPSMAIPAQEAGASDGRDAQWKGATSQQQMSSRRAVRRVTIAL